jgi:hypothetical protein
MKQPTIKDFINGKVTYDREGQYFFIVQPNGGVQMLGELRGWGRLQYFFQRPDKTIDIDSATTYQDEIGQFVADAINEKMRILNCNHDFGYSVNALICKICKQVEQ